MTGSDKIKIDGQLPCWVPVAARHYLAHVEDGLSIRAVARSSRCHPSTVLRQVRRFERRRDDPLIDAALKSLSANANAVDVKKFREKGPMNIQCWNHDLEDGSDLTQTRIDQEAKRVLRRLCEPSAVLAAARDMDTAVVVREIDGGEQLRTAVVHREIAQAMALRDWISCSNPEARIARYFITNLGRGALRRLIAEEENRAGGFLDKPSKGNEDEAWNLTEIGSGRTSQPVRYQAGESPLAGLARRRDRDGQFFLKRELVGVGERLREDFELAQVGIERIENWEACIRGETLTIPAEGPDSSKAAIQRVVHALSHLGPGLGDIALRCCCYLEGLEYTEKKMGWSARSGKIVLRIALQRLLQHYDNTRDDFGPLIG